MVNTKRCLFVRLSQRDAGIEVLEYIFKSFPLARHGGGAHIGHPHSVAIERSSLIPRDRHGYQVRFIPPQASGLR